MGMCSSGDISDGALYNMAEKTWATRRDIQESFEVFAYFRFRDDIFVVASNRSLTRTWYGEFKKRAAALFTLHVEEVSNISVRMLSMDVFIDGRQLRTRPKPPHPGIPLGVDSAHHPSVLATWPRAHLGSMRHLCTHHSDIRPAQMRIIDRFESTGAPPAQVKSLLHFVNTFSDVIKNPPAMNPCTRLIIKYHPAYHHTGFVTKFRNFLANPLWQGVLNSVGIGFLTSADIAWSNAGPHLHLSLRSKPN